MILRVSKVLAKHIQSLLPECKVEVVELLDYDYMQLVGESIYTAEQY